MRAITHLVWYNLLSTSRALDCFTATTYRVGNKTRWLKIDIVEAQCCVMVIISSELILYYNVAETMTTDSMAFQHSTKL